MTQLYFSHKNNFLVAQTKGIVCACSKKKGRNNGKVIIKTVIFKLFLIVVHFATGRNDPIT